MIEIFFPQMCANCEEMVIQRIQFAISPLHELLRSLHVLRNPRHHGIHLPWVVEVMDNFTPDMYADLDYFALCYELAIPSTLIPGLKHWEMTFEEEIAALEHLEKEVLLQELRDIAAHQENDFIPSMARGIEWRGNRCSPNQQLLEDLEAQAEAVIARFMDFLKKYWHTAFLHLWKSLHKQLLSDITAHSHQLQQSPLRLFFQNISERLIWEKASATLYLRKPFQWQYQMRPQDSIILLPSYFSWPHLFIEAAANGMIISYDSSRAKHEALAPQPIEEVSTICKALGEPSRLQILFLLQEHEQTTQGLAQLCYLSEGTVSRHLQILKQARLVESQQQGKYVLYRSTVDISNFLAQLMTQVETPKQQGA